MGIRHGQLMGGRGDGEMGQTSYQPSHPIPSFPFPPFPFIPHPSPHVAVLSPLPSLPNNPISLLCSLPISLPLCFSFPLISQTFPSPLPSLHPFQFPYFSLFFLSSSLTFSPLSLPLLPSSRPYDSVQAAARKTEGNVRKGRHTQQLNDVYLRYKKKEERNRLYF